MDVTPQLIEQIEFAEKFRGYDPDEVDEFLERAGMTIAELSNAVREAQQRAERAENELRNARPAASGGLSDEEEAAQSTRTLMLAKRTADAAIADAREESARIVSEAREMAERQLRDSKTEADRIVGEARVTADQMTVKAAEKAQLEYGSQRDTILAEIGDLEHRKTAHATHVVALEERISHYQGALTEVHGAISTVLENPDLLTHKPVDGFDPRAHLDMQSTPEPSVAEDVALPSRLSEPPSTFSEPFAPSESGSYESSTFDVPQTPAAHETFSDFAEPEAGTGAPSNAEAPREQLSYAPAPESYPPLDEPVDSFDTGAADLGTWADDGATAGADTWGPGSWSELAANEPDAPLFAADAFGDVPEAAPAPDYANTATQAHTFSDFPSEGLPVIGQDRYTRDLDEAVNKVNGESDDPMTAFFEADDEQQTKRFGRRR